MKKTENSKSKTLEKRTPSFDLSERRLVSEGSVIPVMNSQGIVGYIENGNLIFQSGFKYLKYLGKKKAVDYFEKRKTIN